MTLWLVFFLMSIVFCFGWALGSGLGYQNGRADAESLFELQRQLLAEVEDHLAQDTLVHQAGEAVQASAYKRQASAEQRSAAGLIPQEALQLSGQ